MSARQTATSTADTGPTARPAARRVAHLSPQERVARGKAARNETPRSSHGRWLPATNRPDPVAPALAPIVEGLRARDMRFVRVDELDVPGDLSPIGNPQPPTAAPMG